jgi:hypothetical protein
MLPLPKQSAAATRRPVTRAPIETAANSIRDEVTYKPGDQRGTRESDIMAIISIDASRPDKLDGPAP